MSPLVRSPLARSLLALAVLLAASDAKVRPLHDRPLVGSPCDGFIMDIPTQEPYAKVTEELTFEFKSYDRNQVLHNITNLCAAIGAEIASERVEVCNIYQHATMERFAPNVRPLGDTMLSPVYASCETRSECGPIRFRITQKCRPLILPQL